MSELIQAMAVLVQAITELISAKRTTIVDSIVATQFMSRWASVHVTYINSMYQCFNSVNARSINMPFFL